MASLSVGLGHFFTVLIMALALGMDAFSLGIGIGMRGIRLLDILKISFVVGAFHLIMPLLGMVMGSYVGLLLGDIAVYVGGILLVLLGGHMIYQAISGEGLVFFDHRTLWGLLAFSLSVSVDSFSVGVSLGLFSTNVVLVMVMFGMFGGIMSVMGLLLGRKVSSWLGVYGEAIGGFILLLFGIKFVV